MEFDPNSQSNEQKNNQPSRSPAKPKLHVVATRGSITDLKTPVAVIGGYRALLRQAL